MKFQVRFKRTAIEESSTIDIEATDEDHARDIAWSMLDDESVELKWFFVQQKLKPIFGKE